MMKVYVVVLATVVGLCSADLNFLAMGDWGGQGNSPYYTPEEKDTARSMGITAASMNVSFVIGIGDNIYTYGVKDENDPRFKETFEDVFTAPSLANTPFYFVAGNHDHYGNVTGEVAYSSHSKRWKFPSLYYNRIWSIPGTTRTLEIVFIDTVVLAGQTTDACFCVENPEVECVLNPKGPEDLKAAADQWTWIENTLAASKADYLMVAGHYPVWSIAEHGPTQTLVDKLRPMLQKYNVNSYFCGHDHTMEYIQEDGSNIGYVVTGAAHYCDPSVKHTSSVPKNSLKAHLCKDGGYTSVSLSDTAMTVDYFEGAGGNSKFQVTFKPRK